MRLKTLLTVSLLAATSVAWAADSTKVALIKQVYREAAARPDNSLNILKKYADNNLKQAIRTGEKAEGVCLDADPNWNSQDPQVTRKISVTELGNGKVRASFTQYGSRVNVDYLLNCAGGSCKISDVSGIKSLMLKCR